MTLRRITTLGEFRAATKELPDSHPLALSQGATAGIASGIRVAVMRLFEYAAGRWAAPERVKRKVAPDKIREVLVLE